MSARPAARSCDQLPSAHRRGAPLLRARSRRAATALLALLLAGTVLGGCTLGGYRGRFEPAPGVVRVMTARGEAEVLLVAVLGAIRPEHGDRDEVHVRVRLQNPTGQPLALVPEQQRLLTGDLFEFAPGRLIAGTIEAPPGGAVLADLAFAFPDGGAPDLRGLGLQWSLDVEGSTHQGSVTFQRVQSPPPPNYGPYGYPPWSPWHAPSHGFGFYGSGFYH